MSRGRVVSHTLPDRHLPIHQLVEREHRILLPRILHPPSNHLGPLLRPLPVHPRRAPSPLLPPLHPHPLGPPAPLVPRHPIHHLHRVPQPQPLLQLRVLEQGGVQRGEQGQFEDAVVQAVALDQAGPLEELGEAGLQVRLQAEERGEGVGFWVGEGRGGCGFGGGGESGGWWVDGCHCVGTKGVV